MSLTRAAQGAVRARACGVRDAPCAAPLTDPVATSASGEVTIDFDSSTLTRAGNRFDGYAEISDPSATYTTMLVYVPPLVAGGSFVFPIIEKQVFQGLQSLVLQGVGSPDSGTLLVSVVDCLGNDADGVRLTLESDGGIPFYINGSGTPDPLATRTIAATDIGAYGGFANLPANPVTVSGTVVGTTLTFPSRTVFLRAGDDVFTLVRLNAAP